jgi:hypothetical protein
VVITNDGGVRFTGNSHDRSRKTTGMVWLPDFPFAFPSNIINLGVTSLLFEDFKGFFILFL